MGPTNFPSGSGVGGAQSSTPTLWVFPGSCNTFLTLLLTASQTAGALPSGSPAPGLSGQPHAQPPGLASDEGPGPASAVRAPRLAGPRPVAPGLRLRACCARWRLLLSQGRWAASELSVCGGRGAIGTPSRRSVGAGEAGAAAGGSGEPAGGGGQVWGETYGAGSRRGSQGPPRGAGPWSGAGWPWASPFPLRAPGPGPSGRLPAPEPEPQRGGAPARRGRRLQGVPPGREGPEAAQAARPVRAPGGSWGLPGAGVVRVSRKVAAGFPAANLAAPRTAGGPCPEGPVRAQGAGSAPGGPPPRPDRPKPSPLAPGPWHAWGRGTYGGKSWRK